MRGGGRIAQLEADKEISKMIVLSSYTEFLEDMTNGSVPKEWDVFGLVDPNPISYNGMYHYKVLRDFYLRAWGRATNVSGTAYDLEVYLNKAKVASLKWGYIEVPVFESYTISFKVPNVTFNLICQAQC